VAVSRIDLVPASRLLHDVRAAGVGWRLLGANNRELGRSVRVHADLDGLLSELAWLRVWLVGAEARLSSERGNRGWVWRIATDDGDAVAISGRGFRSLQACERNAAGFLDAFARAPVPGLGRGADSAVDDDGGGGHGRGRRLARRRDVERVGEQGDETEGQDRRHDDAHGVT
jgi:hypothetical protein